MTTEIFWDKKLTDLISYHLHIVIMSLYIDKTNHNALFLHHTGKH